MPSESSKQRSVERECCFGPRVRETRKQLQTPRGSSITLLSVLSCVFMMFVDKATSAGWSCFGDREGNKQSTMVTYLADAAKTGNFRWIDKCEVDQVLFEKKQNGICDH